MQRLQFKELFPSKKLLKRVLFQMDSNLTSRKLLPLYEKIYEYQELPETCSPHAKDPNVVFLMNRVLVELRQRTKQQPIPLHRMELYLLKRAAQLGNNDAIALLCYELLRGGNNKPQETVPSQQLLKQLIDQKHALSFKILADLNCAMGQFDEAKEWYKQYLQTVASYRPNYDNIDIRYWGYQHKGEVLEKLGEIEFREGGIENITSCEERFLEAVRLTPLKNCVKSYFYLAMLYLNYDPQRAKVLLEQCCTQGFKESFNELGYLEMNYFKNYMKAREWFKLGMELLQIRCFFGYFQCCVALKHWHKAQKCLESMNKFLLNPTTSELDKNSIKTFISFHGNDIKLVQDHLKVPSTENTTSGGYIPVTSTINESKWDL